MAIGVATAVNSDESSVRRITLRTILAPMSIPSEENITIHQDRYGSSEGWKKAFIRNTVMKNALNRQSVRMLGISGTAAMR